MYSEKDHTFAIIAYKENPYLEKTVLSILNQNIKSNIIVSTSTPNDYIINLCKKYDLRYVVNPNSNGAGSDWNYGYDSCQTKLVTIVHQDDIYNEDFLEKTVEHINKNKNPLIAFTDYYEIREENVEMNVKILRIKRFMNYGFRFRILRKSNFFRTFVLSLGDSISCPTVTLNKEKLGKSIFDEKFKNSCDYMTWVNISKMEGDFIYINKPLVGHRIYPDSATSANIADSSRSREDLEIMTQLWPKKLALFIHKLYVKSERSNKISKG